VKRRGALVSSCALALCALCLPRGASAQYIDLPGTQPGGLAMALPLESGRPCGVTCHFSGDTTAPTAMPYDGWIGSMMGNTLRDPLFLAALTVAEQDRPDVGDWCLRCHTPPGFVNGHTRGSRAASRGATLDLEEREGVSCDACHRMVPTTNLGNAQYVISPTDVRFGPYATIESSRHPGQMSTWTADSRLCGTCHEVTNPAQPLRRADGTDTGQRFPLDTTYSEWARSDYAVAGSPDARIWAWSCDWVMAGLSPPSARGPGAVVDVQDRHGARPPAQARFRGRQCVGPARARGAAHEHRLG
jgi:hypothetical protein